jgi:nucleotide-binding universal stress UspA family protein
MTIIVGVDGSPVSAQALDWAIAEGRLREEAVCAVYAWDYASDSGIPDWIFGAPIVNADTFDVVALQKAAEYRLAEAVEAFDEGGTVERRALRGGAAEILVELSRDADLLVIGSHGQSDLDGVLLGSVSEACTRHAVCPVVVIRDRDARTGRSLGWEPDEVIARELAQNAQTWEALVRLDVREGSELVLEFVYETAGQAADRKLAEFLRSEIAYEVHVDSAGVTGLTKPMSMSLGALDEWVRTMVLAGHVHGGCAFGGWTATVFGQAHSK